MGSIVSQGLGIAIGEQNSINWGGVALSAIGGGVSAGVASIPGLNSASIGSAAGIAQAAARGVISGAVTQGIGVATGLQSSIDWAGVATSGVGAGVGAGIGGSSFGRSLGQFGDQLVSGTAGAIASAATRSVLTGTDFGTNVLATLPQAIGNTIGNAVAAGISSENNTEAQGQQGGGPTNLLAGISSDNGGDGPPSVAPQASAGLSDAGAVGEIVVTAPRRGFTDPSGVYRLYLPTPALAKKPSAEFIQRQRSMLDASRIAHDTYDGVDYV